MNVGDLVRINERVCNHYSEIGREDLFEKAKRMIFTIVDFEFDSEGAKIIIVSSSDGLSKFRNYELERLEDEDPDAIWRLWGDQ